MLSILILISLLSIVFAFYLIFQIQKTSTPDPKLKEISEIIKQGAIVFLNKEYKILFLFVFLITFFLYFSLNFKIAIAFLLGAFFSGMAGSIGMRTAVVANKKTAWALKDNLFKGFKIAFSSGSVMGLSVVGLGLLGITFLYWLFKDPEIIYGFGFGASSIALFARVGGGIFTKAADVGADLVGKIEKNIPEDDPRNPAVIADNVGDNVGDVAGMGADLFESYVDCIIAAMVLGVSSVALFGPFAVVLPLFLAGLGIIASILGNFLIKINWKKSPNVILNIGIFGSAIIMTIFSYFLIRNLFDDLNLFYVFLIGLISGIIIGILTEYYTSDKKNPTQNVARAAETGAGTNIIAGLSLGFLSTLIPVITISLATYFAYYFAGFYGIAIAGVGMLSTLGITLAADCYGPVADNAAGLAEMADLGDDVRKRAEQLDAVGNTTAAIGKGFAIGSAALTGLVLLISFTQIKNLSQINLIQPSVIIGLFIGGLLPFLFCSFAMNAVRRAASKIIYEIRRQFKEIPGLIRGTAKPDYKKCIAISTYAALKEMLLPGSLALFAPILIGFILGPEALVGLLAGSLIVSFLLAVAMANAGGAWDNAKKYIEEGNLGGKGSLAHKSAVVGDTIGDPFKDTAGPSLNILIKLMAIVSLMIAPII